VTIELIWQEFLKIVRAEEGSRVVETWFKAVKLTRWDALERVVYLEAPNLFVKRWVSTHYADLCRQHLSRLLSEEQLTIVFCEPRIVEPYALGQLQETSFHEQYTQETRGKSLVLAADQDKKIHKIALLEKQSETFHAARRLAAPSETAVARVEKPLVPRRRGERADIDLQEQYRFDTFVVGPSNALAFSAAQAAAENTGKLYNPLFIYGGSGLGKTHLLHAIGNYVHMHDRHKVVLYQPADHFITDFVSAIRQNKVYEFEARYHNIDVLLVDDVQFISKKEQTQEAFFRVFNQLHQKQRQLVFTSDSMPCDIKGLAERMRSRLEGGLITDIQMPLLETKIAILHKKAEANNYVLDDDVAYFIGACECSSIRELEGMLIRVIAYASLTKQPVSVGLARKALAHTREAKKEGVGLPLIARFVGKYFSYSVQELRSSKRNKDLAQARHVAMFFMKKLTDASLREIGLFFERKDHTTVLSALEKIERQQRRDRVFAQELRKIEQDLKEQIP